MGRDGASQINSWPKQTSSKQCASVSSSANIHIFRVRGHMILEEENAAINLNEVELGSLVRLFPGFMEDSQEQSQLSMRCKRSVNVARPTHLGATVAARLRTREKTRDASNVGLLGAQPLPARHDMLDDSATAAILETLDGTERATARICL